MSRAVVLGACLALGACSMSNEPDGAALAVERGCVGCHGADGKATAPIYPNLNGQWERYLRLQLMSYRDGKRVNSIMNGFASSLTDDEIRALAEHYGS